MKVKNICIIDKAFGIAIGIVTLLAMTQNVPPTWTVELAYIVAAIPATMFGALGMVCFYIMRAAVMYDEDVPEHDYNDAGKWWQTFERGE